MNEFEIFQNRMLSAHIIWEFAKAYEDHSLERSQPGILIVLPILPICFNSRAVNSIKERRYSEGSLLKVVDEEKDIFTGLQQRMQDMAQHTLDSIYFACVADLIQLDTDDFTIIPSRKIFPQKSYQTLGKDYQDLLKTSKRLGAWASNLNIAEISLYFNITF